MNNDLALFATIETSCTHIRDATIIWKNHLTCPRRVYKYPDNEWVSCVEELQNSCMQLNDALRSISTAHPAWIKEIYPEYTTILNLSHLFQYHFTSISKDTLLSVLTKTIPSLLQSVKNQIKENAAIHEAANSKS
ncbi:MAG: hypothetical protein JW795_02820 [Chitinivibrionales bacterium]|nr:hypothetical protein [Chitinivibrionales bacterium]